MMNKQKKRAVSEGKFQRVANDYRNDELPIKLIDGKMISMVFSGDFMYWLEDTVKENKDGTYDLASSRYFRKHLSECI